MKLQEKNKLQIVVSEETLEKRARAMKGRAD